MTFEIIKRNFVRGLWNELQVKKAKEKGVITEDEYEKIISSKQKK